MGQITSVAELTAKQAEVMALVHQGYTTKEIARLLDIAPSTVDQRADGARRRLGTATRSEAARLYAAQRPMSDQLIYERLPLTSHSESGPTPGASQDELHFQDVAFDERALWDQGAPWHLPRITPRELGKAGKLLVILALASLMLLAAGEAIDLFREIGGSFRS